MRLVSITSAKKEGRYANYTSSRLRNTSYFIPCGDEKKRTCCHKFGRDETENPSSFLAKIISQPSIAGLINTLRGAHGGVKLAREPKDITLLEVIEAIDGPIQLNVCVEWGCVCSFEGNCPVQLIWGDAQNELVAKLKNTNFAQLVLKDSTK